MTQPMTDQDLFDAYVYLLGRALVIRSADVGDGLPGVEGRTVGEGFHRRAGGDPEAGKLA